MDYKLIAVDVDGTLTNSRKEITPRTRYALLEAQRQGKRVVIASGRQPMGVYPIARDLMLDRYIWGDASRLSPEAPVPVAKVDRTTRVAGGRLRMR